MVLQVVFVDRSLETKCMQCHRQSCKLCSQTGLWKQNACNVTDGLASCVREQVSGNKMHTMSQIVLEVVFMDRSLEAKCTQCQDSLASCVCGQVSGNKIRAMSSIRFSATSVVWWFECCLSCNQSGCNPVSRHFTFHLSLSYALYNQFSLFSLFSTAL